MHLKIVCHNKDIEKISKKQLKNVMAYIPLINFVLPSYNSRWVCNTENPPKDFWDSAQAPILACKLA